MYINSIKTDDCHNAANPNPVRQNKKRFEIQTTSEKTHFQAIFSGLLLAGWGGLALERDARQLQYQIRLLNTYSICYFFSADFSWLGVVRPWNVTLDSSNTYF